MMRMTAVSIAALGVTLGSALADQPIPVPKVDYMAEVRVEGTPAPVVMRHHDGTMRFEVPVDGRTASVFLVDIRKGKGIMLMDMAGQKLAMEMGAEKVPVALPKTDGAMARKTGSDRVAGHACTLWSYGDPTGRGIDTACVTDDGIVLRVDQTAGGSRKAVMEVVRLDRSAQNPALFTVPPGYQRMPMPMMGGGMMVPPGLVPPGGMPR